jgi:hypothetical protein
VDLLICLSVTIGPFILIALIFQHFNQNRPRDDEWRELAHRLGLDFSELLGGDRMVDGYYRKYEVGVYTAQVDIRNNEPAAYLNLIQRHRSTCVVVVFEHPLSETKLSLSRETQIAKVGKLLLGEDVLVGDAAFDEHYLVRSKPEELAKRVFSNPDIRRRLLEADYPALSFDGKELKWMRAGVVKDIDLLQRILDLLCNIADAIRRTRPSIISY